MAFRFNEVQHKEFIFSPGSTEADVRSFMRPIKLQS
jgi:hypothetical protein